MLDDEFPQTDEICYLNHAAVAPWPARTRDAVCRFAAENTARGATDYPRWLIVEARLRQRLARLLNAASPDDVALVKNTSEGLSFVAQGLDWRDGDRVVGIADDFPSNRIPWLALSDRNVEFVAVDIRNTIDPEGALIAACEDGARLLAISSVDYVAGRALDLERLGAHCRNHGVLFCIDAIQSLGAMRFDVEACHADFVAADGHKWMLGPEGLGVFWVRPALRAELRLTQFGWHMLAERGDYDAATWTPRSDASRFECGSPNLLAIHALDASLSLLEEVGMTQVEARVRHNSNRLLERLVTLPGVRVHSAAQHPTRSGIVNFQHQRMAAETLYRSLREQGVICAARGGGVRFSPHFYTPAETLDRAVEILSNLIK